MIFKSVPNIPATKAHNSVNRKALIKVGEMHSQVQTMNYAWLNKGEGFTPHFHPDCEEIYYFLKGRGEMKIDEKTFKVKAMDVVVVGANEAHGLYNQQNYRLDFITIRILI